MFDTNALFGFWNRVLVSHLIEAQSCDIRWSGKTAEELEHSLASRGVPSASAFLARHDIVHDAAPLSGQELNKLRDSNDAHVIEAALGFDAQAIVTSNLKDFPPSVLAPRQIVTCLPDHFFKAALAEPLHAIEPASLQRAGLPQTAKRLAQLVANHG